MHASLLNAVASVLPAASTGTTSSGAGGGSFAPFLILLLIFVVAYMLFVRPARNRQRAAIEERRKVSVGDEIITTSGLIASVVDVGEDALTLEIAPGVRVRYVPAAILRVLSDEPEGESETDVTNHEVIDPDEPGDGTDGTKST
ncbi:MAG TPA: preprotein translocase subunit YajC [Mycobacteriales bacterium]|nr:preprotein translocase subunit YajC [Mycobacteriales bacterium]